MTRKRQTLEILADYFIGTGRILGKKEYMARKDTPIRAALVGRQITSWARLDRLIAKNLPEKYALINEEVIGEEFEESEEFEEFEEEDEDAE